ncbi:transglycosylase SLT domain-containing protein [Flavobacteriaceae bacterium F08102]|nr:transglycosylase SLT domain-containing protein [Flavobacteriaceae bacterium F08102]
MKELFFSLVLFSVTVGGAQSIEIPSSEMFASADIPSLATSSSTYEPSEKFTSTLLAERLATLNDNTPFNVPYNATVERFIRLYLKTKRDFYSDLMGRSKRYFPIFEEHLDKHNLPLELKYLSVVESALLPTSKSRVGASGLWQFMYHTALENGLKINSYIDERADPIKSTEAACNYLSYLHKRFGDWELALAAYNAGPGNVSKAIRRAGGQRNYWNIRQYLPAETRGYVPAFYTSLYLFSYADEHGIYPTSIPRKFRETDTIQVHEKTSFASISEKLAIRLEDLIELNPQYKLHTIPKNYVLTLPKNKIEAYLDIPSDQLFAKSVEKATYIRPNEYNSHLVKAGDNLRKIAAKYAITIEQLKKWNGLQTDYLIEDQRLVITDQEIANPIKPTANMVIKPQLPKVAYTSYTVQEGDSLFLISKKFNNVTVNDLREWNNLWDSSYVKPGTTLQILTKNK